MCGSAQSYAEVHAVALQIQSSLRDVIGFKRRVAAAAALCRRCLRRHRGVFFHADSPFGCLGLD